MKSKQSNMSSEAVVCRFNGSRPKRDSQKYYSISVIIIAGLIATLLGLIVGSSIPIFAANWLHQISDLPFTPSVNAEGILIGGCYGLLVTFIFAVIPLGRIHEMPVSRLLRDDDRPLRLWRYLILSGVAAFLLVTLTLFSASDLKLGVIYSVGVALVFASLRAASWAIVLVIKKFKGGKCY
mgnify:CR=1 FL=1